MVFLIEVMFREGSKTGTMLSKKDNSETLTLFCKLDELHQLFPQLRFDYLIVSTLRSLEVLFFKNDRGLNKSWDLFVKRAFLLFQIFLGVFEANSIKNAVISSKLHTGDTRLSHC